MYLEHYTLKCVNVIIELSIVINTIKVVQCWRGQKVYEHFVDLKAAFNADNLDH